MTSQSATLPSEFHTPTVTPVRRMSAPTAVAGACEDLPVVPTLMVEPCSTTVNPRRTVVPEHGSMVRPNDVYWERHHHHPHLPPPQPQQQPSILATVSGAAELEENALVVPGDEEDEDGYVFIGDEFVGEALSGSYDLIGNNNNNSSSNSHGNFIH